MKDDILYHALRNAFPKGIITITPPMLGSANRHSIVQTQRDQKLFVKFYETETRFKNEGIALEVLSRSSSWAILPEASGKEQDIYWRTFPYVELRPVDFDPTQLHQWGHLLGEVHSISAPEGLERSLRAIDCVDRRLQVLRAFPELAKRAEHLWERASPFVTAAVAIEGKDSPVFLMNDFGARNTFIRADTLSMVLLDFEGSGVGDAHWDLGKAWDVELLDPDRRLPFLSGYWEARQLRPDSWPHPATLWVTRFVATLTIFPYAQRVQDRPFFEHGLQKLRILEDEVEGWT